MSKNIAEYDLANAYWTVSEAKTTIPFYPFSRTVFLPDGDFLVIGGLNDQIVNKTSFTDEVFWISEWAVNSYESVYDVKKIASLLRKRGCFSAVFVNSTVFVFGGLNYTDKTMKYCEKLEILDSDWKWIEINKMVESRKNSTACVASKEVVYIFGGGNDFAQASNTVE